MASKTDEVDAEALRKLAWTTPTHVPERLVTGGAEELGKEDFLKLRLQMSQVGEALRKTLRAIAAMEAGSVRDGAVDRLLRIVADLDVELFDLELDEPEPRQLVRLYLEAKGRLDVHTRARFLSTLARAGRFAFDPAIGSDVYLEAVRTRDFDVVHHFGLTLQEHPHLKLPGRLVRAIAEELRSEDTGRQAFAAMMLSYTACPAAVPTLREAVRSNVLAVRQFALEALLRVEDGLREEDLVWLLEDTIRGDRTWDRSEREPPKFGPYQHLLLDAVGRLKPAPVVPFLVAEAAFDPEDPLDEENPRFAIHALARIDPEKALPFIDAQLGRDWEYLKNEAIRALSTLPDELARPRLLKLAEDLRYEVSTPVRAAWRDRFGTECPVPLAGPLASLLDAPPSADFATRLQLLEGPVDGALLLVRALLAEPPTRENLALLLRFRLGTAPLYHDEAPSEEAWFAALLDRWTAELLVDTYLGLVERADVRETVFHDLRTLLETGRIPAETRSRIVDAVVRDLSDEERTSSLWLLKETGLRTPAAAWPALLRRIHSDRRDEEGHDEPKARAAVDVLVRLGPCRPLNDAIVTRLRTAPTPRMFAELLELALKRGVRRAVPLAWERLEAWKGGGDWYAYLRVAWALDAAGQLDERWIRAKLRRPENPLFLVATRVRRIRKVPGARPLVRKALASRARDGAAAVEALGALVLDWEVKFGDPLIAQVLAAGSDAAVAWFFEALDRWFGPLSPIGLEKPLLRLFASGNAAWGSLARWAVREPLDDDDDDDDEDERRKRKLHADARRALFVEAAGLVTDQELRESLEKDAGLRRQRWDEPWDPDPEFESAHFLASQEGEDDAGDDEGDEAEAPSPAEDPE